MTGERVLFQRVFDALIEALVTGPHVREPVTEVNIRSAIKNDHADFFKKSISWSTAENRMSWPLCQTSSTAGQGPSMDAGVKSPG